MVKCDLLRPMIAPQRVTCDEIWRILSFKKHVKTPTRSEKSAKLCKLKNLPEPLAK
jgi:hypothetical protein